MGFDFLAFKECCLEMIANHYNPFKTTNQNEGLIGAGIYRALGIIRKLNW